MNPEENVYIYKAVKFFEIVKKHLIFDVSFLTLYYKVLTLHNQLCWTQILILHIHSSTMISQTSRLAAFKVASSLGNVMSKNSAMVGAATINFKKTPGNSFGSFKEYRENMKTYGPLSASLATKRHFNNSN